MSCDCWPTTASVRPTRRGRHADGSADPASHRSGPRHGPDRDAESTTAPTEPSPEDTGPPTADEPGARLIAGDSDAGTFGPYLEPLLDETGSSTSTLDYKVSSGLARPDFFDWPAASHEQIPAVDPDIVVVTFGGNDGQGLIDASGGVHRRPTGRRRTPPSGSAEYGKRVGEVMDYLSADGRTLIWVGIPNDDNPDVTARLKVQDETVQARPPSARRGLRRHVEPVLRARRNWAEYVIDPRDGQGKDVRADDGFHLNETGAEILALDIAEAIRADLRARGADDLDRLRSTAVDLTYCVRPRAWIACRRAATVSGLKSRAARPASRAPRSPSRRRRR